MKVNKTLLRVIGIVMMIIGFKFSDILLEILRLRVCSNQVHCDFNRVLPDYVMYIGFVVIFMGLALIISSFVSEKK